MRLKQHINAGSFFIIIIIISRGFRTDKRFSRVRSRV